MPSPPSTPTQKHLTRDQRLKILRYAGKRNLTTKSLELLAAPTARPTIYAVSTRQLPVNAVAATQSYRKTG